MQDIPKHPMMDMDLDGELLRYMYSVPGWDVWRSYASFVYASDTLDHGTYVVPSTWSRITCFTAGHDKKNKNKTT